VLASTANNDAPGSVSRQYGLTKYPHAASIQGNCARSVDVARIEVTRTNRVSVPVEEGLVGSLERRINNVNGAIDVGPNRKLVYFARRIPWVQTQIFGITSTSGSSVCTKTIVDRVSYPLPSTYH
jgi:hypothetical protein